MNGPTWKIRPRWKAKVFAEASLPLSTQNSRYLQTFQRQCRKVTAAFDQMHLLRCALVDTNASNPCWEWLWRIWKILFQSVSLIIWQSFESKSYRSNPRLQHADQEIIMRLWYRSDIECFRSSGMTSSALMVLALPLPIEGSGVV